MQLVVTPDPPTNMMLSVTAVSLTVEWDRGWDGGSPQTFHLVYDGNEQIIPDNDPSGNGHYSVKLSGEESTQYTVTLYARNSEGTSSEQTKTATTKCKFGDLLLLSDGVNWLLPKRTIIKFTHCFISHQPSQLSTQIKLQ